MTFGELEQWRAVMFSEKLPKWTLSKDEVFLLGLSYARALHALGNKCNPWKCQSIFGEGVLIVLGKNISSVIYTDIFDKELVLILHLVGRGRGRLSIWMRALKNYDMAQTYDN